MKKKNLLLINLVLLLVSCGNNISSESISSHEINNSSESISFSEELISSESILTSESLIDYSLFNDNLVGKWYIHSTSMGELAINTEIEIFSNYTLKIQNIHFNFVGLYENYEGTNLFISESGITRFIVSNDDPSYMDWGFEDTSGRYDWGTSKREQAQTGYNYDYIGANWPMEQINEYLSTSGSIPSYNAVEYKLLLSEKSQLFGDKRNAMIDIYNVSKNALTYYVSILNENGFSVTKDPSSNFYIGYDINRIYGLRLIQFEEDNNLVIFVYNYETIQHLF